MTIKNLQNVLQVLTDMAALELALASLYKTCGEAFPEDYYFWIAIARQEETHAESIAKLSELVSRHPEAFELNRAFNSVAIRNIRSSIDGYIERIKAKEIPRYRALIIARDMERSVLERNYAEFLKTANLQFMNVIDTLTRDTSLHKDLFIAKLDRTPPG